MKTPASWAAAIRFASGPTVLFLTLLCFLPPRISAAPRQAYPPLPEVGKLVDIRFNEPYHLPTNSIDPSVWVESWSGYALIRERSPVAPWVVPMLGAQTNLQVNPARGALRVFFRPGWSSFSTGLGMGPGGLARLLTLVSSNGTASVAYWSVAINGLEMSWTCCARERRGRRFARAHPLLLRREIG
jgi:hypothetical protein